MCISYKRNNFDHLYVEYSWTMIKNMYYKDLDFMYKLMHMSHCLQQKDFINIHFEIKYCEIIVFRLALVFRSFLEPDVRYFEFEYQRKVILESIMVKD